MKPLVLVLLFALSVNADDPRASNRRAIALMERALEAHGGKTVQEELRAAVTMRGDFINEQQSVVPFAPFETYPQRIDVRIDQPAKRIRVESDAWIAGDFRLQDITLLENGKGFSLTPGNRTWREATGEPPAVLRVFPHRLLTQALQNRASLRMAGESAVTYASGGQFLTLHLDPKTLLVTKLAQVLNTGITGDGYREIVYAGYAKTGTLLLPKTITLITDNAVHGKVSNTYRYESVSTNPAFDAKEFEVPAGYTKADYTYRGNFAVKTLAKDVYLFENVTSTTGQWSYNVMAVVFDDYVLIAEAPNGSGTSEAVLAKVRELAPGKPVRYVVQSHHHGDHLGGIRGYIAEGATIVTGASSKALIEKIAAAPFHLDPDRLHREPKAPKFDVVAKSTTIRDANHEVVVYNIGPSPHAKDMLFVWLPKEKVLYQADLINEGEYVENDTTRHFLAKLAELGLTPAKIAGLHGKVRE